MKKTIQWVHRNVLFLCTLLLLVVIPLYPKLPLVDVRNTWVYIRAEDFFVLFVLLIWGYLLIRNRVSIRTPLTIPILAFWIVGAVATIHGIIIIFPTTANVFPNIAFLNYLRHIEYLSLFFVAYAGMRDKKLLTYIISTIIFTLLGVILYGFAQKYLGFPAFLTMNEEFAKGIPIRLSEMSRVPSTFAGHYDLAAYLVLIIPIVFSLIFGFKNWLIKIVLAFITFMGFVLLFMTVSRVSFFVLVLALLLVLFFHKRRFVLYSIPVMVLFAFLFIAFQSTLLSRFGNTVNEVNVLIDADSGEALGHVDYKSREYLDDKLIRLKNVQQKSELDSTLMGDVSDTQATPSALLDEELFPESIPLVKDANVSNGENLPQGTGYINLSLSPVTQKLGSFFYELTPEDGSTKSAEVVIIYGDFLVKRAAAYDLSFTTRFQGEWPNAITAFEKNILFGSGYGSVSLAVDNNYLRILGEIGVLGMTAFVMLFVAMGVYIRRILPSVDSPIARSYILGFAAGVVGLSLNAILIDVFEASKIAFLLWTLAGITMGLLTAYKVRSLHMGRELVGAALSPLAIAIYISILTFVMFSPMLNNYFVGDDFTWFRWIADCGVNGGSCPNILQRISGYFTEADGFFYRPGTKMYFLLMYTVFWLNQVVFHAVSIALHLIVAVLFFFLARKILKDNLFAALASVLFVLMSGYVEIVFWTSATGHLFNAVFAMIALFLFIQWDERRNIVYLAGSLLSIFLATLFHEQGVVIPLLIIAYKAIISSKTFKLNRIWKKYDYFLLAAPVGLYLLLRLNAGSHWSGGDYSYDLFLLPFNAVGNLLGYLSLSVLGPLSLPIFHSLRDALRENIFLAGIGMVVGVVVLGLLYWRVHRLIDHSSKRIILFGISFFVIALLPFIGLGNITSRYSYLASLGVILILAYLIKRLYGYLLVQGRMVALGIVVIFVAIFSLLHIIQVQQLHMDWHTAGEKVRKFFVAIDSLYINKWANPDAELHFVNVPIRHNDVWIFPVGLHDAVWLTFQHDDLKVFIHPSMEAALNTVGKSTTKWILEFNDDGSVSQVVREDEIEEEFPVNEVQPTE